MSDPSLPIYHRDHFFSSTGKTGPPRADGETFMAFWGQDARSARRAVQSLQLDEIRSVAHILLNKVFFAHRTHFSHMLRPTFPISHLLFLFLKVFFVSAHRTHFSHMSPPTFPISHI